MLEITSPIDLSDPQLVIAISGWVDGGFVTTNVGRYLADLGHVAASFAPDDLYDYRSNRPTLELAGGAASEVRWPSLSISASAGGEGSDLLVLTGAEPDTRWQEAAQAIAELAEAAGVRRVISIGAVAAAVAHTRTTPIMTTSTDPEVEASGLPLGRFSVPAAFVNVVSHHIAESNRTSEVGFWAQIPHYVSGVYWPGVEAIMSRLVSFLGVDVNVAEIVLKAHEVRQRLDRAVASRPDAQDFVRRLEDATPGFGLEGDTDLAEEIEDFLRDLGDDGNPSL